jgi:hypothetical protein
LWTPTPDPSPQGGGERAGVRREGRAFQKIRPQATIMVEALRLVEIMLDRSAAAAETRSPPPCREGSGMGVHKHCLRDNSRI